MSVLCIAVAAVALGLVGTILGVVNALDARGNRRGHLDAVEFPKAVILACQRRLAELRAEGRSGCRRKS